MLEVLEYDDSFEKAWTSYVERSANARIVHHIGWKDVISRGLGHKPRYLIAFDGANVMGVLPLFIVSTWWRAKYVISVPWLDYGGICVDSPDVERAFLSEIERIAVEEDAEFVEFRSVCAGVLPLEKRLDKVTFQLKLDKDPEAMWKNFDAKLRNQIRKAQKSELVAEIGGVDLLDDFYRVFSRNMRDLGTPVWGKDLFDLTLTCFPKAAELVVVRLNSLPIAGGLALTFKNTQYVPSASALREHIKLCPNHAMYWTLIQRACEKGFELFDFGRSTWNSGTFDFKKQWGAPPQQLEWQYYLNRAKHVPHISPDNRKYRMFISLWRRLPLGVANKLGPRLIKNFP
jgi:FemAB-related protein (PEP-CTERM system-associated)